MTIFRDFNSNNKSDRSSEDRRRHKQIVDEAIKKNLPEIISNESIIGQSGKKKISIPIRGIKEYHFVYGKNKSGVGSGKGGESRGDKVGEDQSEEKGNGQGKAGDQEGEDIYEVEVDLDEVMKHVFEDLELPDIDKKKLSDSEEVSYKRIGFQKKGIPPRLAKKQSVIEKIKREKGSIRNNKEYQENLTGEESIEGLKSIRPEGRFPFSEDDLKYHRMREKKEKTFNAVIFCIMDTSGSMDESKKFLAKSFYFLLYQFIKLKYEKVEVVFIAHSTTAKEVSEQDFFHKGESGGTYISSGYNKALEIIETRYNPNIWNIYAFHCSDGDNWSEDSSKTINYAKALTEVCNLFGYVEITPNGSWYYSNNDDSKVKKELQENIKGNNFIAVDIKEKKGVFPALKKILDKELDK